VPEHHARLWQDALRVERRPLAVYTESSLRFALLLRVRPSTADEAMRARE
jgi:hypothetical protein